MINDKKIFILLQILTTLLFCLICKVNAFNCNSVMYCMNGGTCRNSLCICPDGCQGPYCHFCGGIISQCGSYETCNQCRDDPACGWCEDGSGTGLGKCLPGGASGPQTEFKCNKSRWHFTHCPDCQCNGHSTCPDKVTCKQPCANLTVGRNCDKCRAGYWGNPINGGVCQKCECNGQGTLCHGDTGKCFCHTKGMIGDHCEKCDLINHFHGDATKSSCYYDLAIDYQFTFNLSKKEDRHFTQINFRNSPAKPDIDADFSITCSVLAKMNITVRTALGPEKTAFSGLNCSNFRHRFSKTEYHFGSLDNDPLTTFYVYVYDFQPPLWIQIAFSQNPKLNLQQFFITFSTCFLALFLMASVTRVLLILLNLAD